MHRGVLPAPQLLCPGGGKEPFFGRGVVAPSVPPADGHPCLCLWLRGAVGLLPPGGLSLHRTRFLFVAGLSPGPALPRAGDGWQGASGSVERWGCSGSLLQLQCLSVGRGWGFLSRHREQLRSGSGQPPIPEEMPYPTLGWNRAAAHARSTPRKPWALPPFALHYIHFFLGYRLKPGCWDSGCRGAGPAVLSAVMPVIPPCAGARMPLLGCGQCRAGRAKPFATPAHPNPRFAGGLRKNAFFFVVETQRQQGLLSRAVGARDLGLPRVRRTPTPRMSVVSS